jgi:hypothetical protein
MSGIFYGKLCEFFGVLYERFGLQIQVHRERMASQGRERERERESLLNTNDTMVVNKGWFVD